jgi:hypothetical protein
LVREAACDDWVPIVAQLERRVGVEDRWLIGGHKLGAVLQQCHGGETNDQGVVIIAGSDVHMTVII